MRPARRRMDNDGRFVNKRERLTRQVIENTPSTQAAPVSTEVLLYIRLWTASSGAIAGADSPWTDSACAALAADLIAASDGTNVTTSGSTLVSHFRNTLLAISAARRIQWAIAGFAETGIGGNAAILIQPAEGSAEPSMPASLEQAQSGQILLTASLCAALENLPGLPLLPGSETRELQWRTSTEPSSRNTDDQALARLIEQRGVEDPDPIRPDPVLPDPVQPDPVQPVRSRSEQPSASAFTTAPIPPVATQTTQAIGRVPADHATPPLETLLTRIQELPLWQKAAAGAIPLVFIVAIFFTFHSSKPPASTTPATTATPTATTQQPTAHAQPNTSANSATGNAQHTVVTQKSAPKSPPKNPKNDETKTAYGACVINSSEIPLALDSAQVSFQNRRYAEAERRYRNVLACDSKNSRALSGLERARSASALQSKQ